MHFHVFSSGWKPVVEEVDPDYKRTVFVVSKFDNRSVHSKVMLGKLARELIDRYGTQDERV